MIPVMPTVALVAASLSAVFSVLFFVLESLLFTTPAGRSVFQTTAEQAELTKIWAFNQGFYNLFLAIGIVVGVGLMVTGRSEEGRALVLFGCASMVGAALVLVLAGGKSFARGALAQGIPPLVAIAALLM
jgi:putative membrane protein